MNIALCVSALSYAMGGVSTHILDLCKQYSHMDEIDSVYVCCDGGEHVTELQKISKVQYLSVPFDFAGRQVNELVNGYRVLWDGLKNKKIDIIHVHSQRILPIVHMIKFFHGIPYVWTNHIDAIPSPKLFKAMCRVMRFPIISVSEQLRTMMLTDYSCSPKKCYVVNNGTDLDSLKPLTKQECERLEEEYQIDRVKTPYVICLLSRIFYVKGHSILLRAINQSSYKNQIKVLFAGHTYSSEIDYKKSLEEYCVKNDIAVKFLPYSKPRDVFGISDLFVLPSLYEGFALVCIEALAMGCAVIRSRTPGWQEMEKWVEIVEKNDVQGLTAMIDKVIENGFNKEKTLLGKLAVETMFTKEKCAENTIEVYKDIMGK